VNPRRRKGIQDKRESRRGEEGSRRGGEGIQERRTGNPGKDKRESRRGGEGILEWRRWIPESWRIKCFTYAREGRILFVKRQINHKIFSNDKLSSALPYIF
jgi:hypothetical protein